MTHKDIYEKFMIEYDKANITSSYPSLTKYEIATILDKAYLALIAQKLTGNNQRKVAFEGDIKAIEDLRPLFTSEQVINDDNGIVNASNELVFNIPSKMMYYIQSTLRHTKITTSLDDREHVVLNIRLMPHEVASKFMATDSNMPWIKEPVGFLENNTLHVLYDSYQLKNNKPNLATITFLKKPVMFTEASNSTGSFTLNRSKLNGYDILN